MKFLLILILVFSYGFINGQNLNSDTISIISQTVEDSLKMELDKVIQEINEYERQVISRHDSICNNIEMQLKEDSEKKIFGKLSAKKRSDLMRKLRVEKGAMDIMRKSYELTRNSIKEEYEEKLKKLNY